MPQSSNLRAAIGLQRSPADMPFVKGPKGTHGKKKKKDMIGQRGRHSNQSEYKEQAAAGTLPPSHAPPSSKAPSTADSIQVKKLTRQVGNRDKKIEVLTKKLRSATNVGTYEKKCHKDTIKDCEKNHVKIPGGVPTTKFSDLKTDEERQAVVTQLQTAYQDLVQKLGMTPNEAKVAQLYWDSVYGILSASTDPTPTTSTCTNYTTTTDAVTTGASTSTTPLPPNHFENVFFNAGPTTSNTTTSPRNRRHTHVRRTHTVTAHPAQPVHGGRTALMDEEWEKLMRIRSIADEISISDNALRRIFIAAGTLSGCHTSLSSTSSSSIIIISIAVIVTISMTIITTIIIIIIIIIIVSIIITLHEFVINSSE